MSNNPQWNTFQPPDTAILSSPTTYHRNSLGNTSNGMPSFGIFGQEERELESINQHKSTHHPYSTSTYSSFSSTQSSTTYGSSSSSYMPPDSPNSKFPPIGVFNENSMGGEPTTPTSTPLSNGNSSSSIFGGNSNSYGDTSPNSQGTRETGIIEKLLHSYGFIQCCERQARLFFHFSQFDGNIEHLKIGDPVEFEMTYDRRTGKPIASSVTKIGPEVVLSEERVTGVVTTELRHEGVTEREGNYQGRISYENRGECFFLPYGPEDVEGNVALRSGDKVSFQIATSQSRGGNLAARHVRLENPAHPVRYQGVVCSMKESFGFIERADVVKEIFFHFSEVKGTLREELKLGDDVEFTIQTRNGKEVACGIVKLSSGTVVFEDLGQEILRGQVLKAIKKGQPWSQSDPLPGRIRYRGKDRSEVEISFGDKDQRGEYTLKHGDWVEFIVATDRRDQLQRATRISLLDESFTVSGEKREQGIVGVVKEGFGFVRCVERDTRMFFHFSEVIDADREVLVNDEVEFTVVQDATTPNRQSAIRIKHLLNGTVQFESITQKEIAGTVEREAANSWGQRTNGSKNSPTTGGSGDKTPQEAGLILYEMNGVSNSIMFYLKDCEPRQIPREGDQVSFDICQIRQCKDPLAVSIHVTLERPIPSPPVTPPPSPSVNNHPQTPTKNNEEVVQPKQGFITALKDGFGFIETLDHTREIFFHFSTFDGDSNTLDLGQEVEYCVNGKGSSSGRLSTESVHLLPKGSIKLASLNEELLEGVVVRPLRSVNPDQAEYAGIVQITKDDTLGDEYEFGITSLANKREILQLSDPVTFQLDEDGRAANIVALRKKLRGTVEATKGQFGFLSYEVDGRKLFFHTSEVKDGAQLQTGDEVEFVLVTNQRTGKSSACSVTKLSSAQRPERLISRLRTVSVDDQGPRMMTIRQPKGPDGTKGFTFVRENKTIMI